jgi:hypothetical protein
MLRASWPVPRDTYITDGIPELLTRLALVPYDLTAYDAGDRRDGPGAAGVV